MSERTAAVILAAGSGSRFASDQHKLRTEVRGRPIVRWALDAAVAADIGPVVIVTGAVDISDLVPAGVEEIENPDWSTGQASSLQAAITWAREAELAAIVVGLADQPFVAADDWQRVAAADAPIAMAEFDGRRRPPTRLHREIWDLLPIDGDEGARSLIKSRPDLVTAVPCGGEPADVDTLEDLEQWS